MLAFERGLLVLGCGAQQHPAVSAAGDHARASGFRHGYTGRVSGDAREINQRGRVLDAGCGINKFPGAIGVDTHPASRADVIADLDQPPLPFADCSFAEIRATHVIEHVASVMRTMEDFHRLLAPGGRLIIVTPHYTDFSSFCDPTHRWHLNSFSLRHFGEDHGGFGYYSRVPLP